MSQMGVTDFKAHCLEVMDRVRRTGKPVVVTRRGVPLVKVVPAEPVVAGGLGWLADRTEVVGDVEASLFTDTEWGEFARATDAQVAEPAMTYGGPRAKRRGRSRR